MKDIHTPASYDTLMQTRQMGLDVAIRNATPSSTPTASGWGAIRSISGSWISFLNNRG